MTGWLDDPEFATDRPFGPQTLPYGVLRTEVGRQVAVRTGNSAVPLSSLPLGQRLDALCEHGSLDPLLAAGAPVWTELRERLTGLLTAASAPPGARPVPLADPVLGFTVADFVDFYSSRVHAENGGRILRPDEKEPLAPNWSHLPVAYHGRAGTVVVSGTPVTRPHGQRRSRTGPVFSPTRRLDIEAEVGFVCGGPVRSRVSTSDVAEHVFGVVLVNDWSARDFQAWEARPLGPFLGKSFATSVSAWITPLDALHAARVEPPEPAEPLLDYLRCAEPWGLDLTLEIRCNGHLVSRPPFATTAWTPAQQLAHLTANGATVRPGDLFASGTVSGHDRQWGSFLELSWGGSETIRLGEDERTFLEDGDTVAITATAPGQDGSVVGVAEVAGTVHPA